MKFYAHPFSNNSMRAQLYLDEKGLAYEYVTVDLFKGEHRQPAYLAINQRGQLEIQYKSITGSPEPRRVIAPHALFHAVGRWYVRAWSTEHSDFRDYNLFRIDQAGDITAAAIDHTLDFEWMHEIDLILAPNPALSESQQAALHAEYAMTEGRLVVTKRLSQTFYLMTEHNFDVAPDTLPPGKQQLVLLNREEVVNARNTARKLSIDAIERASR